MKKLISFVSSLAMAAALVGCSAKTVSGDFTGEAAGHAGKENPVKVTITLKDSKITNVVAEGSGETEGIGTKAFEAMPEAMVAGNTVEVDMISGATETSSAILEAAAAAIKSAGLKPEDFAAGKTEAVKGEDVTKDTDVVVIGAGGAGMTAAVVAKDAGKDVIILESQAMAGGNSVRSTGGMNAGKTEFQDNNEFAEATGVEKTLAAAEAYKGDNEEFIADLAKTVKSQWADYQKAPEGYFDSVELFELDTMVGGAGKNDPELVKTLAENSADAIDWLDSVGATLHDVAQFGGAAVKRIHRPVDENGKTISVGAYMVPILEKNCEERGIEIMFNTTANEILMDGEQAVGVKAEGANGETVTINAKSVVIAAGGFGANNEMVVAQDHPELEGYITTNAPGILGQGIEMGTAVGAATVDMDQIQLHPTVHVTDEGAAALITEGLRGDGAILVNQEGNRFYDEVSTRDKVSDAENNQTGGYSWLVLDQAMYDASAVIQGYVTKGYALQGEDAAALAKELDMDASALEATLEKWNTCVREGKDEEFNRTSFNHELTGTLYAIKVQPGIHHTMGGLKINTATEVLNEEGSAIKGLFAAGEVTGGVHGANRLGGNAVADFTIFGRLTGQNAADFAK